jgi:cytochrome c2
MPYAVYSSVSGEVIVMHCGSCVRWGRGTQHETGPYLTGVRAVHLHSSKIARIEQAVRPRNDWPSGSNRQIV